MTRRSNLYGDFNERKFSLEGGGAFYGTFHPADEGSFSSAKFVYERRLLRTRPRAKISAGDIFFADKERYLVANHESGYRKLFKSFRAFRITDRLEWTQDTEGAIDPVTKRPKRGAQNSRGSIWATKERIQDEELDISTRVKQERYRIVCAEPVAIGDTIGNLNVTRSDRELGVYLLEAEA